MSTASATDPNAAADAYRLKYRGYTIQLLRHGTQWHLIDGLPCVAGYVVTDGGICNVMPGATWFETVKQAKHGIDCLIAAGGDPSTACKWGPDGLLLDGVDARKFWDLIRQDLPVKEALDEALRVRNRALELLASILKARSPAQCAAIQDAADLLIEQGMLREPA